MSRIRTVSFRLIAMACALAFAPSAADACSIAEAYTVVPLTADDDSGLLAYARRQLHFPIQRQLHFPIVTS